jgi:hypothetical protein
MDDLDALAKARSRGNVRETRASIEHRSALKIFRWPLILLGVTIGPPFLFCALFFQSLGKGHPPTIGFAFAYVFFVAPFAAPLGACLSAVSFVRYPAVRLRAALFTLFFTSGWAASWAWFIRLKGLSWL